jgi:hypothetical protein
MQVRQAGRGVLLNNRSMEQVEDERALHGNLESRSPPVPRQSSFIFGEFLVSFTFTHIDARSLSH